MNEVKEIVRKHILDRYLPGEQAENLPDDAPLRSSGILDSLATLQLIRFIENEFKIEVSNSEIGVDRFDRINDIAGLIASKKGAKA